RVLRVAEHYELGAVRLAEEDRAGGPQAGDGSRVLGWNEVLQDWRAGGQGKAGRGDDVLRGERHAGERDVGAVTGGLVNASRVGERFAAIAQRDDRVQLGVHAIDPLEVRGDDLARGNGTRADQAGKICRRG